MTITVTISDPALVRAAEAEAAARGGLDAQGVCEETLLFNCNRWREDHGVDRITASAFILRFTPTEYSGIRTAGDTDPKIAGVIARAESEPFVWLGSQEVQSAMTYLVSLNLLTAQRAAEILAY